MSEAIQEKFDPKQVENELLQIAQNRVEDPMETAAMVFSMYRPEFLKRIPLLSSKALRRVLQLLVEYPLNDKALTSTSLLEKEVVMLGSSMLESKFIMMQQTYLEGAEQLVKAQDELLFGKEEVIEVKEKKKRAPKKEKV